MATKLKDLLHAIVSRLGEQNADLHETVDDLASSAGSSTSSGGATTKPKAGTKPKGGASKGETK